MAIDPTFLVPLSTIGQFIIDELTINPLPGRVFFYKPDKLTLKNVYEQTGDPFNPFQVTPNPIQLNAAGGFVNGSGNIFIPYLYFFDEVDNQTSELYYVEVRRPLPDNSLAWALDNFGENYPASGLPEEAGELTNLCPSYGFDIPTFNGFYTQANEQPVRNWRHPSDELNDIAQGWRWVNNGTASSDFFYEFVDPGTIPGNPLYKLVLTQTTFGTPGTTNWLGFEITKGNQLQDKELTYQIHLDDTTSTIGTYNVGIVAANNLNTVTNVGTIAVNASFEQQSINFQMPDVSGIISNANEIIYLVIELPFAFPAATALGFSATLTTIGDVIIADDDIPTTNSGTQAATQFWSQLGGGIVEGNNAGNSGLPFSNAKGYITIFNDVANVWTGAKNETGAYETFASSLPLNGQTLVSNQPLLSTITDRFLGTAIAQVGGNSFVITPINATEFDINTRISSNPYTPWTSSTAAIIITQQGGGTGIPQLTVISQVANVLNVEFTNAALNADVVEVPFIKSETGIVFPAAGYLQRNINNMVGVYAIVASFPNLLNFTHNTNVVSANTGVLPAQSSITFAPGGVGAATNIQASLQSVSGGGATAQVYRNYLCFVNTAPVLSEMPIPPPMVIQFHVNSNGVQIPSANHTYTVPLETADLSNGTLLATKLNETISGNAAGGHKITVNALPVNGTFLNCSTGNANFVIIFHNTDTSGTKPVNPEPDRPPIYVVITNATTTAQLTTLLANTYVSKIGTIPSVADLKLTPLNETSDLQYYVRV